MESWYISQPQPTMNSGFENDEWDNYVNDAFDEVLTETKLGQTVLLCNGLYDVETGLFETEFETQAVVQNVTPDAYTQGWKRQILTRISDMLVDYKYIKIKDTKNEWQIYLIMTMPDTNRIYTKAVIHECNYILRWQNKDKKIFDYPCFIENASQYNTGENNVNSVVRTPYSQLMCWISFDDNTLAIDRNSRFFIDYNYEKPMVFRTTSVSHVEYSYGDKRIVRFTLTEEAYNPDTDNIELMICNYVESNDSPDDKPIIITYTGEPYIRIGGRKTFNVDYEHEVVFALVYSSILEGKIKLEVDENKCVIKISNDVSIVGNHFKLTASYGNEQAEILITIKGVM